MLKIIFAYFDYYLFLCNRIINQHNQNMKRIFKYLCIAATAAMSLFPTIASGQDAIYEIGVPATKKTIVREMKENVAIVYSYDGTDGWFSYVDMNTPDCYSAKIPGLEVNDFEIYKDTVYFCGKGGGVAVAGYFDINATFFMGAPAQYAFMPSSIYCQIDNPFPNYEDIIDLRKIVVMNNPGGQPHMLMIGEATCTHSVNLVNRCIVDVYYDGSDWEIAMTQEHESILYFDDIAVTDNYVIAAGHKHPQDGEYLTSFPRPTNPIVSIFYGCIGSSGTMPWHVYSAGGMSCYTTAWDEDHLVAHITGDIFATICHGGYSGSLPNNLGGTVLSLYNTASTVYNRGYVSDSSANYKDLRFNKYTNSLYLLPGAVNSTLHDGYIEYVFDATLSKVNHVYKHHNNPGTDEGSLDAALYSIQPGYGQALVTSTLTSKLELWRHMPNTGCSNMEEVDWTGMCTNSGVFDVPMIYSSQSIAFRTYLPNIEHKIVETICEGEQQ